MKLSTSKSITLLLIVFVLSVFLWVIGNSRGRSFKLQNGYIAKVSSPLFSEGAQRIDVHVTKDGAEIDEVRGVIFFSLTSEPAWKDRLVAKYPCDRRFLVLMKENDSSPAIVFFCLDTLTGDSYPILNPPEDMTTRDYSERSEEAWKTLGALIAESCEGEEWIRDVDVE